MIRRGVMLLVLGAALAFGIWLSTLAPLPPAPMSPLAALSEANGWLNTSEPVTAETLRGRVVLVMFWSYSNVQSLQILPIVNAWHNRYREYGLEIVGVHTPEFSFEQSPEQVAIAVERLSIPFTVAIDSHRLIWSAFLAGEWPSYYVAGPDGAMLGFQVGAGREAQVEQYLQSLLIDRGWSPPPPRRAEWREMLADVLRVPVDAAWSPEMRFRVPPGNWFVGPQPPVEGEPRVYRVPNALPVHAAALEGVWQFEGDRARLIGPTGLLAVRYHAAQCHLIVEGVPGGPPLMIRLDGRPMPTALAGPDVRLSGPDGLVALDHPRPYILVRGPKAEVHTLEVVLPNGAAVYACTFTG